MFAFLKKLFQPSKPSAAEAWQAIQNKTNGKAADQVISGFWLYAAPVHLALQRDSFSLAAPAPLPLEIDEAEALTAAFNQHFGADNMRFFWHENTWFLRLENNPDIETTAPDAALNRDIGAYLPKGVGAMQWARFTNEVQMLLFEHPVNTAREAKNLPVMNSLWCYGN